MRQIQRPGSALPLLFAVIAASGAAGQIQPILTVTSFAEYECFGTIVARAGDADGDGGPDLLIGDRRSTATIAQNTMFLVDGDNGDVEEVYGIGNVTGTSDCALLRPWRISVGRDRDGDGVRDLLVGYPGSSTGPAGSALALSGRNGAVQLSFVTVRMSLGDRYGSGVVEHGSSMGSQELDVVVAAPGEDAFGFNAGALFVFDGVTGDTAQFGPLGRPGKGPGGFGASLWPIGDTDADGRQDFVVVQQGERPPGDDRSAHRVYVYSGALPSFRFELFPSSTRPRGLLGEFGASVTGVPDLDGDGRDEILIGDTNAMSETHLFSTGRAWLFSGASGALVDSLDIPDPAGNLSAHMGRSVAALGDVTGDALSELVVGAPGFDSGSDHPTNQGVNNGRVFVYDGATRDLIYTLRSPNEGSQQNGFFGTSVASAGDIDGDGRTEVAVGAPLEFPTGGPVPSGRVYVFSLPPVSPTQPGPPESTLRLSSPRPHPVRDRAAIDFELLQAGEVRLVLLDVLGREVAVLAEGRFAAGLHSAQVDALSVAPGPYIARLQSGNTAVSRRVTVSR